jgi:hypothetical protein
MDSSGRYVENASKDICPQNLPISKLVSMYINIAQADFIKFPSDRELPADSFLFAIMSKNFPCSYVE